ncbi:MAG TPA: Sec-independent protein translocase protein TatB [Vitreimonas sp.]|uniref:Sec-independent protein translocase protein TatB n=1 Tax=Vitreimonas sp. TaxID=3069702 RepID=UPI002D6BE866|nr:Sec-independent protein translocase protein TatB [Vitreimonas sp.]HYD86825.1 Sec-independent protein translocase protein TatB [Vitreimonas sp.]
MLPSLGFNEIIILGILALVVVGPKDLPLLFRKLGRWTAKLRGMAQEFRSGFDELARQAELDELKREVDALRRTTSLHEIRNELAKPLPTLEDYAGVQPTPAIPPPAAAAPAVEADDDVSAEREADEAHAQPEAEADRRGHAEAAPVARSAP